MKKTDTIIIGAGPVGLFAVHQLGIKGLKGCKTQSKLLDILSRMKKSGMLLF